MDSILIIISVILLFVILYYLLSKENYNSNYNQMSHLPFATPPTINNCNNLGYENLVILQDSYPPTTIKYSCQEPCGKYETSNARNPNVYSEYGYILPSDISF